MIDLVERIAEQIYTIGMQETQPELPDWGSSEQTPQKEKARRIAQAIVAMIPPTAKDMPD